MFESTANRLMQAVLPGPATESWIGGSFLFNCHSMMFEPSERTSPDYTFEICQFTENSREYYKAHQLDCNTLRFTSLIANSDRTPPLTVGVVPLTMENFNAVTREAAVLKTFNHRNIAHYSNISFKRGFILLEMSYSIRLSDLLEGVKREKFEKYQNTPAGDADMDEYLQLGIPEAPAAKITRAILDGLQYVHCRGVWHSRLSTDCILLGVHDARIAISGWSYLKPTKCRIQKAPILSRFMAPEQASRTLEGRRYTACSMQPVETQLSEMVDIWSVGIIICEMILGTSVYGDVSPDDLAMLIFELNFPNLQEYSPYPISPVLDEIASTCLHRNPSKRKSASLMLQKFEKYFYNYSDSGDIIEESIDNWLHITNLSTSPDTYSGIISKTRVDKFSKFSYIKDVEHDLAKLKWQRFREKRIQRNRGLSLNTGGNHICIKIRDEFSLFPRVTPFKYIDTLAHPDNSSTVYLLQEAVMTLAKERHLTNVQAFKVCTLIAKLTQMALAIDEKVDGVVVKESGWLETCMILRILVPLKDLPASVIRQDWNTLYYSLLIEYTYSPPPHG